MTSTPAVGTLRATHLRVLLADEDEEALVRLGDVLAELERRVDQIQTRRTGTVGRGRVSLLRTTTRLPWGPTKHPR